MHFVYYLHIVFSVTLYGILIANYYYVAVAFKAKNVNLIKFTLKNSLSIDRIVLLPLFIIPFITGTLLSIHLQIPITVPWLLSAFILLGTSFIFFLVVHLIKVQNVNATSIPKFVFLFHLFNLTIIILFALIIHDAVTRTTLFG